MRLALTTVIFFEIWRYFPLAFLFILARLQAIPKSLYEAAEVDGASPVKKFIHITLPQITAIISILFMIRFIWNFNKFEDIFLLTGGASGTRTLPINVYQQGFAVSDIGMGSAVSIVIVMLLLAFMIRFIWNFNKFEDIFLLTGGASGTRTLPINVYQQGFAVSDIGMGSAVSIVIVMLLLTFMVIYFRLIGKRANEV